MTINRYCKNFKRKLTMSKPIFLLIALYLIPGAAIAQKQVALTFDDGPRANGEVNSLKDLPLLKKIDSLQIPAALFINEQKLILPNTSTPNTDALKFWAESPYITLGNHTYSHLRYSTTPDSVFIKDVIAGEGETRKLSNALNKTLVHFRFPFNDLGADSAQQTFIAQELNKLGYQVTPFTIESSDWMFNALYEHYIKKEHTNEAKRIGQLYLHKTLDYFQHFDSLCTKLYNRPVKQIYLAHDNQLNADYLPILYKKLKEQGYTFISLDEALTDPVYSQPNKYYKKWGISWFYRWMPTQDERRNWMVAEPDLSSIEREYNDIENL